MKQDAGSIFLWGAFLILLSCLVLIGYSVYSASELESSKNTPYVPEVYVERAPVSSPEPGSVIEFDTPLIKSEDDEEEEDRIRKTMEAGVM